MTEADCWYINFAKDFPERHYGGIAEFVSKNRIPGCYHIQAINTPTSDGGEFLTQARIVPWGGGKTAANAKRIAAKKYPEEDWVKRSRFVLGNPNMVEPAKLRIDVGKCYRAKRPLKAPDGGYNDRQVIFINAFRTEVQYNGPAVPIGRNYPCVPMSKFQKWAGKEITEEEYLEPEGKK